MDAQDDLHFEILKSERVRAGILATLLGFLFAANLLVLLFVPNESNPFIRVAGQNFPLRSMMLFYAAAFVYELLARTVIGSAIEKRVHPPEPVRYVNALIETSLPTVLMVLIVRSIGPEVALNSPLPMLYFVFISLSTLRLGASLSIFTGFVAGLEFSALAVYSLPAGSGDTDFFTSTYPIFVKSVVMVIAGIVCGFVGAQIRRRLVASMESQREKNRIVGMFGQYVNPAVVEQLLTQPVDHKGEVRHVTIMFLDIRGFTTFAERRSPSEVVDYLNTLFAMMIARVNANHGIINKFLGDGFMACFGAPLSDGRDTENAVRAAMEIAEKLERMNADGSIPATRIGIGLHAGEVVTGSVGSEERKEYTLIGDTVNLASRVEQLTKQYGVVLLVTDAVWQVVKADYQGRALDPVTVKGREAPVAIYSLR